MLGKSRRIGETTWKARSVLSCRVATSEAGNAKYRIIEKKTEKALFIETMQTSAKTANTIQAGTRICDYPFY